MGSMCCCNKCACVWKADKETGKIKWKRNLFTDAVSVCDDEENICVCVEPTKDIEDNGEEITLYNRFGLYFLNKNSGKIDFDQSFNMYAERKFEEDYNEYLPTFDHHGFVHRYNDRTYVYTKSSGQLRVYENKLLTYQMHLLGNISAINVNGNNDYPVEFFNNKLLIFGKPSVGNLVTVSYINGRLSIELPPSGNFTLRFSIGGQVNIANGAINPFFPISQVFWDNFTFNGGTIQQTTDITILFEISAGDAVQLYSDNHNDLFITSIDLDTYDTILHSINLDSSTWLNQIALTNTSTTNTISVPEYAWSSSSGSNLILSSNGYGHILWSSMSETVTRPANVFDQYLPDDILFFDWTRVGNTMFSELVPEDNFPTLADILNEGVGNYLTSLRSPGSIDDSTDPSISAKCTHVYDNGDEINSNFSLVFTFPYSGDNLDPIDGMINGLEDGLRVHVLYEVIYEDPIGTPFSFPTPTTLSLDNGQNSTIYGFPRYPLNTLSFPAVAQTYSDQSFPATSRTYYYRDVAGFQDPNDREYFYFKLYYYVTASYEVTHTYQTFLRVFNTVDLSDLDTSESSTIDFARYDTRFNSSIEKVANDKYAIIDYERVG